jgi:sugar O-acyltransferase (sialic acid O-acetyltransferase NeuD family)
LEHYIYGAGGHGRVVFEAMQMANMECNGFIDDNVKGLSQNLPVISSIDAKKIDNIYIHIAIGGCKVREEIFLNSPFRNNFSVFHPLSSVASDAKISSGVFVASGSVIGPNVHIGEASIINHNAVVDHDSTIGQFSHIAINAAVCGPVKIGRGVLIGAGAVILPGINICDYAIIGAGSVVTKNISTPKTYIGKASNLIEHTKNID